LFGSLIDRSEIAKTQLTVESLSLRVNENCSNELISK